MKIVGLRDWKLIRIDAKKSRTIRFSSNIRKDIQHTSQEEGNLTEDVKSNRKIF